MEQKEEKMTVLLVRPRKFPCRVKVFNTDRAICELLGSEELATIEFDDDAVLVYRADAEEKGLEWNRAFVVDGALSEAVAGDFLIAYRDPESGAYTDLPGYLEDAYTATFTPPQQVFKGSRGLFAKSYWPGTLLQSWA